MKKQIKYIGKVQTGLFARPTGRGELVYLQAKHFDEFGQLQTSLHPDLPAIGISERHILRKGDVLFAAKGGKNFATVFHDDNVPSVASTSFFVIRLTDANVLPQFLVWFLNSEIAQSKLKGQAIGTSIPSISKQVLDNLEISVPSIQSQLIVLQIANLRNIEKRLKEKINCLREKQIQHQITTAINKNHG